MQVDLIEAIRNYLAVFNVPLRVITPPFDELEKMDFGMRRSLDPEFDWQEMGRTLLCEENNPPCTLSITEDMFGARYAFFPAPQRTDLLYMAGPWRGLARTPDQLVWGRRSLGRQGNAVLQNYFDSIPHLDENAVVASLKSLVAMLYPEGTFRVRRLTEFSPLKVQPDARHFTEPDALSDVSAAALEQRYALENTYMNAVTAGDTEAALAALDQCIRIDMGDWFTDALRNQKNNLIIFNTLLRKAAERADVHPYYLNILSTQYAYKIEDVSDLNAAVALSREMVLGYCDYVHRYSVRKYSPMVQKVVNYINFNIAAPLSLKTLSDEFFVNPSYLSRVFRQETGQTLTDYINAQRVQRAAYYLATTDSSVAMIAESVGVLDVNYFSKIFKKFQGSTPTQYRRDHHTG
ncbi:MAG: AraC family transcriptional regulator [Oscillospiraceae bacterium]|nr:AraC family transcriptional regulator [Oscillospiraceae bacterium]